MFAQPKGTCFHDLSPSAPRQRPLTPGCIKVGLAEALSVFSFRRGSPNHLEGFSFLSVSQHLSRAAGGWVWIWPSLSPPELT